MFALLENEDANEDILLSRLHLCASLSSAAGSEDQGTHGITSEDWSAILDFADQHLLKKAGTRKFDVIIPPDQLP